jgi:uncharacterized protein DUF5666
LLLFSAVLGWAQNNPATPKPGSGIPQTPVPGAQPGTPAPQQPTQAPQGATPDSPAVPSPTQPGSTRQAPAGQQTSGAPATSGAAGTSSGTQPSAADQQKYGRQKSGAAQPQSAPAEPLPPAQPKTEILDSSATSGALATDGHDPILDPAPMPQTVTTLVGGTISSIDRMRNRMTVHIYGGGHWTVNFDERTHIFHNGAETTQLALKKGERVYVDTQLDNNRHDIFARNVRVGVATPPADADGQIVEIDAKHNELTLRDTINSVPVRFAVDQDTRISAGQTPAAFKDVRPGALVHVRFAPESPNRGLAREIDILAAPGSAFTFAGVITYLDVHRGLLALQNLSDDKNYEIHFATSRVPDTRRLVVGNEVRIVATFEGHQYTAQTIDVTKAFKPMDK